MTKSATSTWLCGERRVEIHPQRPFLLGILNVTPDSFSDGGKYLSPGEAVRHGIDLLQVANGLDVGGESTRPGALPVPATEERKRVVGVLREIRREMPEAILSIDTYKAEVALAALEMAGVNVINDVGAGDWDPGMWQVLENSQAGYICMHSAGRPREMQNQPSYEDVVSEVGAFLQAKKKEWKHRKMNPERMVHDVGIGFGKLAEHNRQLVQADWSGSGRPLVWGLSRKSFLEATRMEKNMKDRDEALDFWHRHLLEKGEPMIWRVHDPLKIRESWEIFSDEARVVAR